VKLKVSSTIRLDARGQAVLVLNFNSFLIKLAVSATSGGADT